MSYYTVVVASYCAITNMWEELDHLASRDVIGHVIFDSP